MEQTLWWSNSLVQCIAQQPTFSYWLLPISRIVIHTDAARDEQVSGLGYVIEGDVSLSEYRVLTGEYTSMEAEFHALVEALRVASIESDSETKCEIYSDCEPMVRKMHGDQRLPDDWQKYYESCHWLLGKFDEWELNYCRRSSNTNAHELARRGLRQGRAEQNT